MNYLTCTPRQMMNADFDRIVNGIFNQNRMSRDYANLDFPAVDIEEKKDKFILTADLPGNAKKDVKVTILDSVLTLTGGKTGAEEKEEPLYHYRERQAGSFTRSFHLPESVNEENIEADFKHGVLKVILHKHEEILPKELEIKIS